MEAKKAAGLSLLGAQMRRSALEMVYRATSGHLGGSMSLCEILAVPDILEDLSPSVILCQYCISTKCVWIPPTLVILTVTALY